MWRLRAFGGLSIEDDGGTTAIVATRRRPLALLALLTIAGDRGISREKVVAMLWPESDEEHGRNSLSQVLAALRRDMAADDLVTGTLELRLNRSAITSDVAEFECSVASGANDRAAALYQGPFLDGFFVRDAADFERWTDEHRRRLHSMCAGTLEQLARAAADRSDHLAAVAWWRQLAALEPTSAQAISGLMRALAMVGDRSGARRQYRVYEELMRQEFDAAPDPTVSALAADLLTDRVVAPASVTSTDDLTRQEPAQPPIATHDAATGLRTIQRIPLSKLSRVSLGGLIATAALAAVAVITARQNRSTDSIAGNTGRRVVVRTFKNNSGDTALDGLGPMAADWIARGLTETPSVDVAGTESDIAAGDPSGSKTSALDPTALGRLVRARYVITGSYYTQSDSLFLQAEVYDAETGRRVLAVPAIADSTKAKTRALERLRGRVTDGLVPYFDSSIVVTARVPPRYDAYEEFLLGNQLYDTDRLASIRHLRAAARLDPSFMYARLRLISALHVTNAFATRDSVIAEVAAKRAVLTPYESAAFEFRVALARRDFDAAYHASASARRLAPNSTWAAFELGEAALFNGRPNEAVRLLEALDPESGALRSSPLYYDFLCAAYHTLHRMPELRRCADRERRQYPSLPLPRVMGALGNANSVEHSLDSLISVGAPRSQMAGGLLALNAHGLFELDVHGHSDEARGVARRLLAHVGPMMDDSLTADALVDMRAGLLAFLGEWGELARVVDETAPSHRSSLALSLRGVASAMLGDTADARRRAEAITPGKSLTGPVERARILASLGDMQGALTLLRTTDAPGYSWQYHGDVIYRLMRNYPPFEQYLKQRD